MDEVSEGAMNEKRLYKLLREILLALDYVHQSGMIHLDIKPDNIFIKNDQYKLGDFGLVSKIENHDDVEEGDSRYMSMELLSGDLEDLTKSDIFSLGATLYEICLGRGLPENGQEWQDIRKGVLLPMGNNSFDFQMIVQIMMSPEKEDRPTASELLKKRQLLSEEQRQLIVERNKAEAANMALNAQMKLMKATPKKILARSNTIC
jgi:serine/threonine protein kinase